ncbi:hypothetical protein EST38_g3003 [Candolleomyces aberdarensis]|uniref:Macro domain-containing protein n=1 Tax=Candolleomyces aberdarensis TaxID=2316362 RepID=A0A4Q2DRK0_9AGAR|nr:hypothetical protein EST38_g3003 [Candolleomyces aberdarensis]
MSSTPASRERSASPGRAPAPHASAFIRLGSIKTVAQMYQDKELKAAEGDKVKRPSKITRGYNLPASHIIHTVGPVYSSLDVETKAEQLASCYQTSLQLAAENSLKHVAFPSISTGIYGYPIEDATHIALQVARDFCDSEDGDKLDRIILVVWSNRDKGVYEALIPEYFPPAQAASEEQAAGSSEAAAPKEDTTSAAAAAEPTETAAPKEDSTAGAAEPAEAAAPKEDTTTTAPAAAEPAEAVKADS